MSNAEGRQWPVVLPDGALWVPAEACGELAGALRLLADLRAGRRVPASVRQPRITRSVQSIADAAGRAAVEHQAARHRAASTWGAPTSVVVAPAQLVPVSTADEITTAQASDLTGLSTERWRQLAASGRIRARKTHRGVWLLDRQAVVSRDTRSDGDGSAGEVRLERAAG